MALIRSVQLMDIILKQPSGNVCDIVDQGLPLTAELVFDTCTVLGYSS